MKVLAGIVQGDLLREAISSVFVCFSSFLQGSFLFLSVSNYQKSISVFSNSRAGAVISLFIIFSDKKEISYFISHICIYIFSNSRVIPKIAISKANSNAVQLSMRCCYALY